MPCLIIVALGLVKLAVAQEAATLAIQAISCAGNFATSCDFIRRGTCKDDSPSGIDELEESLSRCQATRLFAVT